MVLDLLAKGYINKDALLLKNYKKIGLSENQVVIIEMLLHLDKTMLTPSDVSQYMNVPIDDIKKEVDELVDNKIIRVTSKTVDLSGLFMKLAQSLDDEGNLDDNDLIKSLNTRFKTMLSLEDINYLNEKILSKLSKKEVLVLAAESTAKTFKDFKEELNKAESKKVKPITKINWL